MILRRPKLPTRDVASSPGPVPGVPPAAALAADTWLRRFRAILVGVLGVVVAGIASLAFYTSFEAIKSYAHGSGGIAPEHDWAVPLLVDSFIAVAAGADLWYATTGQARGQWERWWPKALLAGAVSVSFVLNVAHAAKDDWAARGIAAIPPAALVLGVELLMMVLRRATALRTERLQALQPVAKSRAKSQPAPNFPQAGTSTVPADPPTAEPVGGRLALAAPLKPKPARKPVGERGQRTDQARALLRRLRAAGGPRPGTNALVTRVCEETGLTRSSRLRSLVLEEWPESAPESTASRDEDGAA